MVYASVGQEADKIGRRTGAPKWGFYVHGELDEWR